MPPLLPATEHVTNAGPDLHFPQRPIRVIASLTAHSDSYAIEVRVTFGKPETCPPSSLHRRATIPDS